MLPTLTARGLLKVKPGRVGGVEVRYGAASRDAARAMRHHRTPHVSRGATHHGLVLHGGVPPHVQQVHVAVR